MDFKLGKLHMVIIAIVIIAVVVVVYMAINSASTPVIASGDTVKVFYTGTFTNGTVFDTNVGNTPLEFTVGSGQIIKGFDEGVVGMKLNEHKTITVAANDAYGEINPELIVQIPLTKFGNHTVEPGMIITENSSSGEQLEGKVTEVNSGNATVDFNPPLAGQTLVFNITVVSIQKAAK